MYQRAQSYYRGMKALDKSRWRKHFTKNKKSGLLNNGFYGQGIVMAFSPPEHCRLFAQKKAYKGGVTGTSGPPSSYAPVLAT